MGCEQNICHVCSRGEVWTSVALQICRLQAVDRIFIMYVAGVVALSCLWTSLDLVDLPAELWVVDRISIMYVAGDVDLWTCGLWVVDRISIMYLQEVWTCELWVVDRISIMHQCSRRFGPLWTCGL